MTSSDGASPAPSPAPDQKALGSIETEVKILWKIGAAAATMFLGMLGVMVVRVFDLPTENDIERQVDPVRIQLLQINDRLDRLGKFDDKLLELIVDLHRLELAKREGLPPDRFPELLDRYRNRFRTAPPQTSAFLSPLPNGVKYSVKPSDEVDGAIAFTIQQPQGLVPVLAMRGGTVVERTAVPEKRGTFWKVVLLHDMGYRTYYGRLVTDQPTVAPGERVEPGQQIGFARVASATCLRVAILKPGSDELSDPRQFLPPL